MLTIGWAIEGPTGGNELAFVGRFDIDERAFSGVIVPTAEGVVPDASELAPDDAVGAFLFELQD